MTRGFSKAIITGNLTRDPEVRNTVNGKTFCSFTVAVNRSYKDSNGNQQDAVSFIDCVAWGRGAEIIAQYAKKGTGMLVSGPLEQRSWEDKSSGQRRSRTEIIVEDFNFMGGANFDNASGNSYGGSSYGGNSEGSSATNMPAGEAPEVVPEDISDGQMDLSEVPF